MKNIPSSHWLTYNGSRKMAFINGTLPICLVLMLAMTLQLEKDEKEREKDAYDVRHIGFAVTNFRLRSMGYRTNRS